MAKEIEKIIFNCIPANYDGTNPDSYIFIIKTAQAICEHIEKNYVKIVWDKDYPKNTFYMGNDKFLKVPTNHKNEE